MHASITIIIVNWNSAEFLRKCLSALGKQTCPSADIVVVDVGYATAGKRSAFSSFHGHRNMVWLYFKNMSGPLLWVYLPHHLLINLASIVWLSVQDQMGILLRAKRNALRKLPRMWRKRKQIQASRKESAAELRRVMAKGFPGKRTCKETWHMEKT
jgi:GT2 family glycosyltransferase